MYSGNKFVIGAAGRTYHDASYVTWLETELAKSTARAEKLENEVAVLVQSSVTAKFKVGQKVYYWRSLEVVKEGEVQRRRVGQAKVVTVGDEVVCLSDFGLVFTCPCEKVFLSETDARQALEESGLTSAVKE